MLKTAANDLPRVFVFEDNPKFRAQLLAILSRRHTMNVFNDCTDALEAMLKAPPDVVIVEDRLLHGNGADLLSEKRRDKGLSRIPFIVLGDDETCDLIDPMSDDRVDVYLRKPCSKNRLLDQLSNSLSRGVEDEWNALPPTQRSALQNTVREFQDISDAIEKGEPLDIHATRQSCKPLAEAVHNQQYHQILEGVKNHHNYTYVHSLRVATYLSLFGHGIGIRGNDLQTLVTGGLVHDVGKMVTPQDILNKNGKLVGEEWDAMKRHVEHSKDLLDQAHGDSKAIRIIAEQHHEKLDGSGYPLGLKGNQLDELARMSVIVDIFGALTDRRSYKPAFPPEKAFSILEEMGDRLDQSLLNLFRESLSNGANAACAHPAIAH